jgi:hypothetical protein
VDLIEVEHKIDKVFELLIPARRAQRCKAAEQIVVDLDLRT